jgi:hypothetical protein
MGDGRTFRHGRHRLSARKIARRWTASIDGQRLAGFFGSEAQALGAALLLVTVGEHDLDALSGGDTLVCGRDSR